MRFAKWLFFCALIGAVALESSACSPVPMTYKKTQDGQLVPQYGPTDYAFIGEVLGEENVVVKSSSGDKSVTALRIRVLTSETSTAAPDDILKVYRHMMGGEYCQLWGGASLTTKDMAIGAKVRVITPRLDIPLWELHARFVRVE